MAAFRDFTAKQKEFIRDADRRWNIKSGATRSGKTYLDRLYTIPSRIRSRMGLDGLTIILGVTRSTIERNVLKPMRDFWGERLVGTISGDNTCRLFGETAYCLGAEKISQQAKIRGASFKYVYGDEMAEWNVEVFNLLKSRLDQSYSCCDGTCNPKGPNHWLKRFIDDPKIKNLVYYQPYTIFDNPTLDKVVVQSLCAEYQGTVDYQRYILGRWVASEGACYPIYAENPEAYRIKECPPLRQINIGVDFGGNKSASTFVCVGFTPLFDKAIVLAAHKVTGIITPQRLDGEFCDFVKECVQRYGKRVNVYCDSAEQTLIAGLRQAARKEALACTINNALKSPINERIRLLNRMIGRKGFATLGANEQVETALCEAVYNPKSWEDERLDDGTSDIDTIDALEYALEPLGKLLLNERG